MVKTYYSPKTYGYSGLKLKGFEVDDIFSAATNPDMMPTSTLDLLKFHLRHIILNYMYGLIGLWKIIKYKFNKVIWGFWLVMAWIYEVLLGNLTISAFFYPNQNLNPKTIFNDSNNSLSALKYRMSKLKYIPRHIGVMFKFHDMAMPYVPSLPESYQLANGQIVIPTDEETQFVKSEIKALDQRFNKHTAEQLDRLYEDICNLVVWCILINVRKITIYEKSGRLGNDHTAIMKAILKKLDSTYYNRRNHGDNADFDIDAIRLNPNFEEVGISITTPAKEKTLTFSLGSVFQNCNLKRADFDYKNKNSHSLCINGIHNEDNYLPDFSGLEIIFLDHTDGRDRIISLTKELSKTAIDRHNEEDMKNNRLNIDDNFILESFQNQIHGFPDLLITHDSSKSLDGYPPLGAMNSTIYYSKIEKSTSFRFKIFLKALQFYSKLIQSSEMRKRV